jgi:RNA-directed DNA polymerase
MVLFHEDPGVLNGWYTQMDEFLRSRLGLRLHPNKKHLNRADSGIDFTGFIIKPGRTYLRQTSLSGCKRKIRAWEQQGSPVDAKTLETVSQSLNSYLGMLRQVNGYRARKALCRRVESLFLRADGGHTKVRPAPRN